MLLPKAKKSFGQNFLTDTHILSRISHAIEIREKNIIEIGPGYGALTLALLEKIPQRLDLVELEVDIIPLLKRTLQMPLNATKTVYSPPDVKEKTEIHLHQKDILTFIPTHVPYSLIANIPYYITSPILFYFCYPGLKGAPTKKTDFLFTPLFEGPEEMIIMMQKEVGEKILGGKTKKRHESFFSLAIKQACKSIEIVCPVPRGSFEPRPKVDSLVLKFVGKKERDYETEFRYLSLWQEAFTQPRKTLLSNFKSAGRVLSAEALIDLGHTPQVRAEALTEDDWQKLSLLLF